MEQYVPQADLLAKTDVFLCHGGLGSMPGAMDACCPMVVVPLGADQLWNAERAHGLGLCVVVEPSDVTTDRLRAVIAEVLASQHHRLAAADVKAEIARMPSLDLLMSELQHVVDGHRTASGVEDGALRRR